MAEFKVIDDAEFAAARARGRRASAVPKAISARLDRRRHYVVVGLDTGIEFAFDPRRTPGLAHASGDDLVGVRIEGVGGTLHFPRLDADYSVPHLIEAFIGPIDWTKRDARRAASRANGRRGGRPKLDKVSAG